MNRSSIALRTALLTINEGTFEIRPPATTRCKLMELSFISATATAQTLGLGRPAAAGVTPTNVLFQRNDPGDPASLINGVIAWGGARPTAPAIYHRRWSLLAAIGSGVIFSFPQGIIVPVSGSLSIHNITASVASDVSAEIEE